LQDRQLLAKIRQNEMVVSVTIHQLSDLKIWLRENSQQAALDAVCLDSLILHDAEGNWDYSHGALFAAKCRRILPAFKLEFQGKSTYQMGTAAALGAIHAGTETLICSVGGAFDEIAWEEVWLALSVAGNNQLKPIDHLLGRCREILAVAGMSPLLHKPLLGDNVFAHESGIHVHGVLRQPEIYETYAPEDIGQTRLLTIGGSSGRLAVETAAALLGYECPAETVALVNAQIKQMSAAQGHGLTKRQLQSLFFKYCSQRQEGEHGSVAASC
jgi:homocitrate synthase NifV